MNPRRLRGDATPLIAAATAATCAGRGVDPGKRHTITRGTILASFSLSVPER